MSGKSESGQSHKGFFAVDRRSWAAVCRLGMNPAVAYLVIACGTGGDNRTSKWSAKAIEERIGIQHSRAVAAIGKLEQAGCLWRDPASKHNQPKYKLRPAHKIPGCAGYPPAALAAEDQRIYETLGDGWMQVPASISSNNTTQWQRWRTSKPRDKVKQLVRDGYAEEHDDDRFYRAVRYDVEAAAKPDWIWLPNTLVEGIAGEVAPVTLVWQTSNILTLRLLVNLYGAHRLREDNGIHFRRIRQQYTRHHVGEYAQYTIWGFQPGTKATWPNASFVVPHLEGLDPGSEAYSAALQEFWACLERLESLGLVEFVPHLIHHDSDDGEIIHPMAFDDTGTQMEREVAWAARDAAEAWLIKGRVDRADNAGLVALVPVLNHYENVELVGIARLRYRPWTAPTQAFLARDQRWQSAIDNFRDL